MSAAGIGAGVGAGLGLASNLISLGSANKATIGQINREGNNLAINMRQININRQAIEDDLGSFLSASALATAKNMSTAKVIMSASGTVGGTTSQVSKQAYMQQILEEADLIKQARNREVGLLTEQLSRQIQFRQTADATRSTIASPLQAVVGSLTSMIGGASQGATIGSSFGGASGKALTTQELSTKQQAESALHRTPRSQW